MDAIKFDALCTRALGNGDLSPAGMALYSLAMDLDSLRERIREGAEQMARRFGKYAADLAEGLSVAEPPTGYSTLRDLDRDAAAYEAKLSAFRALFPIATGKAYADVVREARAAEGGAR